MSRRLRLTVVLLACAGITATAAAAQTAGVQPTVKPGTGKTRTRFVVSFRAPQSTLRSGVTSVHYVVAASVRTRAKACASSASATVNTATAGTIVRVKLIPRGARGRWCTGTFHGKIEEFMSTICACPPPLALIRSVIPCPVSPGLIRSGIPCPLSPPVICPKIRCSAAIVPVPETIGKFSFRVRK